MPIHIFKTILIVGFIFNSSSSAFTTRSVLNRSSTACFLTRRDVMASLCAGFVVASSIIPSKAADDVETKTPIIELFKNFLPNHSSELTSVQDLNNPLDSISWNGPKKRGLNPEQMADAINDGLREREWFVTGKGLPELYSDKNFSFSDPQVSLSGYEQYCRQVRRLFDQETARCEIVCCSVTAPDTITVLWRNSGRVNIGPFGVVLKPYVVTTRLRMDLDDGNLIVSQVDEFESDGAGLLLYQIPFLRPLAGAPAPSVDELREQCDFYTCQLRS